VAALAQLWVTKSYSEMDKLKRDWIKWEDCTESFHYFLGSTKIVDESFDLEAIDSQQSKKAGKYTKQLLHACYYAKHKAKTNEIVTYMAGRTFETSKLSCSRLWKGQSDIVYGRTGS
jgi:hypothetical protein